MSNIEEDINILKNAIKCNEKQFEEIGTNIILQEDEQEAIENILSKLEADKKRIKELEEKNKTLKNFTESIFNGDVTKDFIPVQKVKDKIEELKKDYEDSKDENGETEYYYPDYTIRKLEELLEDK